MIYDLGAFCKRWLDICFGGGKSCFEVGEALKWYIRSRGGRFSCSWSMVTVKWLQLMRLTKTRGCGIIYTCSREDLSSR